MLVKCPECGQEISDKAPNCIHCGYPIGELSKTNRCNEFKFDYEKKCPLCGNVSWSYDEKMGLVSCNVCHIVGGENERVHQQYITKLKNAQSFSQSTNFNLNYSRQFDAPINNQEKCRDNCDNCIYLSKNR